MPKRARPAAPVTPPASTGTSTDAPLTLDQIDHELARLSAKYRNATGAHARIEAMIDLDKWLDARNAHTETRDLEAHLAQT